MSEDKKYYDNPFGDISREEYQKRIDKCETKSRVLQDEYFDTLVQLIDIRSQEETEKTVEDKMYYVRKMKDLQRHICHQLNYGRQLQMDLSRSALEQAFTPHVKSLLINTYEEKIKELEENV